MSKIPLRKSSTRTHTTDNKCLFSLYRKAKALTQKAGYAQEQRLQARAVGHPFTETDLLREAAWVILCSGFREKIVRKAFGYISLCFCDWESACEILKREEQCREAALCAIRNFGKIDAIIAVCRIVDESGFADLKRRIFSDPLKELKKLPYIGDVTVFHLAKNLGFDLAKPDRHLARIAKATGYDDVNKMCREISRIWGDPVSVVDTILWRWAVLKAQMKI